MPYESGRGTDRRTFVKLAAGTMLASGLGLRAYADGSPDGPNQKRVYPDRWVYVSRSFDTDKLQGNLAALVEALAKAKPATSKGVFLRKVALSSTMGVGVRVDAASINAAAPAQV